MISPTKAYFEMLVDFCQANDVMLIFDEVIAFRLGYEGAQGVHGVTPDLTALGKIIGGGFPVGAVAGRSNVMAVFEEGGGLPHGGTFNANPVTMVAGMATMKEMTRMLLTGSTRWVSKAVTNSMRRLSAPWVTAQVSGQGSLMRLHLTDRPMNSYQSVYPKREEADRMLALHHHLLNAGIYIAPYGLLCLSTVNTWGRCSAFDRHSHRRLSEELKIEVSDQEND